VITDAMIYVELGWDIYSKQLKGYEFMFAFMPYMHTENMVYQKKGEHNFRAHKQLYHQYPNARETKRSLTDPKKTSYMGSIEPTNYDKEYAMLKSMEPHVTGHKQTIQMFGRFPKRNKALGRETTFQEEQYLNREEVKKRPY